VTESGVYRFATFRSGWQPSATVERTYSITGGDLTFSPFDPAEHVSDRPILVRITSPNQDPRLRIRVVTEGDPADPDNPTKREIGNGGSVLITRSPTTLKAIAFGDGIVPGAPREGNYRNVNSPARMGEEVAPPPGASFAAAPLIPLHETTSTNVVDRTTNVFQLQHRHVAHVPDAPGGGKVYAVAEGFEPDVQWWFPQHDAFIEFEQTINEPDPERVVTLYHTENVGPAINQQLVVSLAAAPSSVVHYGSRGIVGGRRGQGADASPHLWIDLSGDQPLLRARSPEIGRIAVELRQTPQGSPTPGFIGMQVVQVKPYLPDSPEMLVDLGSELRPHRTVARPHVPNVTIGRGPGPFDGFIYQHERPGQMTDGRVFAIRRNDLPFQMEVLWRQMDEYGRVVWPHEIRRYTAQWPASMQLYVRGSLPDPEGPHVRIPARLRPALIPHQDPPGHAILVGAVGEQPAVFRCEVPTGSPEGRSLLFFDLERDATGVNWIGFETVLAVRNIDTRHFNLSPAAWPIGSEVLDSHQSVSYPVSGAVPGYVHVPDGRILAGKAADRYAEAIYGSFDTQFEPLSATTSGQIFGVNDGNLEVWWFNTRTNQTWQRGTFVQWPSLVKRYALHWPDNAIPLDLARQSQDSPDHNIDPALHHNSGIYRVNSPADVGYNPNEEHAFLGQGSQGRRVYALRDDLNAASTSLPYVLHQYQRGPGSTAPWAMRTYRVITGDLVYPGTAGSSIQAPLPLSTIDDYQGLGVSGPYWNDKNGVYWAKAAGDDGGVARVVMRYWYPAQVSNHDFWVPGRPGLQHGDMLPWLDVRARLLGQSSTDGQPINVNYDIRWPDNVPILQLGETLVNAKRGLPAIAGQLSVEVLYEQGRASGELVKLIDPVAGYSVPLEERALAKVKRIMLPDRFYFEALPPSLQRRVWYDRSQNRLAFVGRFIEGAAAGFGEDFLELNVLTDRDVAALNAIAPAGAEGNALRTAVASLASQAGNLRLISPQATDFRLQALTAGHSIGEGYVVLAFQNNTNRTTTNDAVTPMVIRVAQPLYRGEIKVLYPPSPFDEKLTLRHSGDFAGRAEEYEFDWRYLPAGIDPGYREDPVGWANRGITNAPTVPFEQWTKVMTVPPSGHGSVDYTLDGASLLTISDNWFMCRYRPLNPTHPKHLQWSEPTAPVLAEGWIKRVIKGNTEFNLGLATQVEDLFRSYQTSSNRVLATMIGLAGAAYEGSVPLNLGSARDAGLIQIYETVLRRGMKLSVDAGLDYDPANTALLLAGSRLAQLYGLLGNEAYADAVDPTLTFGTYGGVQIGNLSASVHAFQNQTAGINSLLQEELALLRGRAEPGVRPFFNRLPPNVTFGAGEAAYVLNYGISDVDGRDGINAADAQLLYPQGHGDAWGHYLSGLKIYYRLLQNTNYTWVPRSEAVNIVVGGVGSLNVEVDYQDERRFAELAAAKARTGADSANLTYRLRYTENPGGQWQGYLDEEAGRAWGLSEWAVRAGQGALLDWAVGTSLLPDEDLDPSHQRDIQKIDRGSIRELGEIANAYRQVQVQVDQADAGLNPLGLSPNAVPFDLDPNISAAGGGTTHFEQIANRAKGALRNAAQVFAVAQGAAGLLREQFEDVQKFSTQVGNQELDYRNRLIEIFGYPYREDVPSKGGIYEDSYVESGPDLYHYMLVDPSRLPGLDRGGEREFSVRMLKHHLTRLAGDDATVKKITFHMSTEGFGVVKPRRWTQGRKAPGEIQLAMSDLFQAYGRFLSAAREHANVLDQIEVQERVVKAQAALNGAELSALGTEISILNAANGQQKALNAMIAEARAEQVRFQNKAAFANIVGTALAEALPTGSGLAPDVTSPIRSGIRAAYAAKGQEAAEDAAEQGLLELSHQQAKEAVQNESSVQIRVAQRGVVVARTNLAMASAQAQLQQLVRSEINRRLELFNLQEAMQQSADRYLVVLTRGLRLLEELERYRTQTAAELQQYRYRDMLFRIYRNEGVQKYRAQFDLAGRYVYLAAKAYDFETTLLVPDALAGAAVLADIVRARSIGLVDGNGELLPLPTPFVGDPGLASALGKLQADWQVAKSRYGLNNPATSSLRFSLRREHFRIAEPGPAWRETLQQHRVANLLDLPAYVRHCIPSHDPASTFEPGLVIPFSTTVMDGRNLFGRIKAAGDSSYSAAYFATKIRSVGVELPNFDNRLFPRTPRGYLVPLGADVMRVPGRPALTREFYVVDQILPLPSAITVPIISDPEYLPVFDSISSPGDFAGIRQLPDFLLSYPGDGYDPVTKSSRRLVGRSVWNTEWAFIFRGRELNPTDPDAALDTLALGPVGAGGTRNGNGITDIVLILETDAFAGN
jgi:hypothetical protein